MTETTDKKSDAIEFDLQGEIKGNASNNNTRNLGKGNKNEVSVQSASGNVDTKGVVNNRVNKHCKTNNTSQPGMQ